MEENILEPQSPEPVQPSAPSPAKPVRKTVKPQVEGINSPYANVMPAEKPSKLTDAELKIIKDPASVSSSSPIKTASPFVKKETPKLTTEHKSSGKFIWVAITIIAIALVIGVMYLWKNFQSATNLKTATKNPETKTENVTPSPEPLPTSTPETATPAPTPVAPSVTKLKVNSTPTGYLNVRSQPSTSGQQLSQVHPGDELQYTEVQNGWYKILLPDGSTGWVIGTYVTEIKS